MGRRVDQPRKSVSGVSEFLAMGGHGPYVWGAWILAALVLAANAAAAARDKRRALDEVRQAKGENPTAQ